MSAERWTNNKRRDGVSVVKGIDGYVVMPHAEGLPVDKCPCCELPFKTVKAAQLCADALFPMEVSSGAG